MTAGATLRAAGRAAALAATAAVLGATSVSRGPEVVQDAVTSCGPAGTLTFEDVEPGPGCGRDDTLRVEGGPEAGLTGLAEPSQDVDGAYVLAGPVTLPGAIPALTLRRVCLTSAPVDGVRTVTCEGEVPEAACSGTLTERTPPPVGSAP